jgi:hypothetical protein
MNLERESRAAKALIVLLLGLPSCVLAIGSRDSSDRDSRYQFTTDKDGNTIKLDRRTGASWVLENTDSSHTWKRLSDPTSD